MNIQAKNRIDEYWDAIVSLMGDDEREAAHQKYAPCSHAEFLRHYCEDNDGFAEVVEREFMIDITEG